MGKLTDEAILKANEESAPHIRRFLRWVANQNSIEINECHDDGFDPFIRIELIPTANQIEALVDTFIELNGQE